MNRIPHWGIDVEGRPAIWLKGTEEVEVVGEVHHQAHLARVASPVLQGERKMDAAAWLVPEPPTQDGLFVSVWLSGGRVGVMSPRIATLWHPVLGQLGAHYGRPVACFARVIGRGGAPTDDEGNALAVRLFLPPPF